MHTVYTNMSLSDSAKLSQKPENIVTQTDTELHKNLQMLVLCLVENIES